MDKWQVRLGRNPLILLGLMANRGRRDRRSVSNLMRSSESRFDPP